MSYQNSPVFSKDTLGGSETGLEGRVKQIWTAWTRTIRRRRSWRGKIKGGGWKIEMREKWDGKYGDADGDEDKDKEEE